MQTTSIIIPNYNGKSLLQNCIRSIKQHTHTPYEIIVVDNGSNDGSLAFCYEEQVKFISFPINHGFPKACNAGMKLAKGEALMLLNNDTIVTTNWLDNMLRCLYSQENIGIVGPLTNHASGQQKIKEPFTTIEEMAEMINQVNPSRWFEIHRIVGICMLFKRSLLSSVGYLDEQFSPGHYEDDDYCYRARLAGYRLMVAGDVFIYHEGSASFGKERTRDIKQLLSRNKQRFMNKWSVNPADFI